MVFGWFKLKAVPEKAPPRQDVYAGLRSQVLSLKASDLRVTPGEAMPVVWGVLMEFPRPSAVVTLVSLGDNTTRLYFSNRGGLIGAGEHQPVASATQSYIAMAQHYHSQFRVATEYPLPDVGNVRFYLLTFVGVLTAEAKEQELGDQTHALSPLFFQGHEVIACIRRSTEGQ